MSATPSQSPLFFAKFLDRLGRTHYRDIRTGRFISKPVVVRVSTTLNFVVQGIYYGAIVQTWHYGDPDPRTVEDQHAELIRMVEDHVGYPQSEWWFSVRVGYAEQEVEEYHPAWKAIEQKNW